MKHGNQISGIIASAFTFTGVSVQAETLRLGEFQSTRHIVSVKGTTNWRDARELGAVGISSRDPEVYTAVERGRWGLWPMRYPAVSGIEVIVLTLLMSFPQNHPVPA